MKRVSGPRGFTLVELLVVSAVVALLTAFAAPKIQAAVAASREAQVAQDLQQIQDALERNYMDQASYPIRLNDLVERGYLKPTTFRSPVSGHWYFYAVDDNRDSGQARAYALGAPPRDAYPEESKTLFRGRRAVPEGRNPALKARAWLRWEVRADGDDVLRIRLKYENDWTTIENEADLPASLEGYRYSCRPDALDRCDLFTN